MTSGTSRRLGWLLLVVVVGSLFAVGVSRDSGPQNQRERIDAISKRLACPTCDGESVFESRASSSENLRREIARLVSSGQFSDGEIVQTIDAAYAQDLTLTPDASGLEGLAWALPVVVAVLAVAGLWYAFVRWRRESDREATDDDRAVVAAALADADTDER
jgi:cytochrome c-type biogenesis protein CcmH